MPTKPQSYDPNSPNEQAPPLPSAPLININDICNLQPPLTRRGKGPGLLILAPDDYHKDDRSDPALDPPPVKKWAEEGFAVLSILLEAEMDMADFWRCVSEGLKALAEHPALEKTKGNEFGAVLHDNDGSLNLLGIDPFSTTISCCVAYCAHPPNEAPPMPTHIHYSTSKTSPYYPPPADTNPSPATITTSHHPKTLPHFTLPDSADYDSTAANLAHTQSLTFLRKHLGGPHFDIEAIWEEHTYWEFERRSVAQTMATMVAEPYVNHVPTMTGGIGRDKLQAFYRDHFIFCNPPDTALTPVSRTVGPDKIVDEFIFTCTHTTTIPWLLPSIPPTNKPLSIPMVAVVNVRGDRLYHEHIWWDQATTLRQAGLLPTHLPAPAATSRESGQGGVSDGLLVRLPVAGAECASKLLDERDENSNDMIDPSWAKR